MPRHDGTRPAETAEALMRSRYSAFAMGLGDYLIATQAPAQTRQTAQEVGAWAKSIQWLGLKILRVERGGEKDARGTVEFEARFRENGQEVVQHEVSRFDRAGGRWRYLDGRTVKKAR